jgi:hypothetical protein
MTPDYIYERVLDHIAMGPNNCWVSTYLANEDGYPKVQWSVNTQKYLLTVHRAVWMYLNGPIPDDMVVDHTCFERRCVNPSHLRLLTRSENASIRFNKPDHNYCTNGHDQRVVGVYVWPSAGKHKRCRECKRSYNATRRKIKE